MAIRPTTRRLTRLLLPFITLVLFAAIVATGVVLVMDELWPLMSVKGVGLHHATLRSWIDHAPLLAALAYAALYAAIAVLMLPGSALMVVAAGLLFGASVGIPLAWVSSLMAATLAFTLAHGALPWLPQAGRLPAPLTRLRSGLTRRPLATMLVLRLSPGLPFALVNVAPAAVGMPRWAFVLGSAIGFLPSRIAFASAGAGLSATIADLNRTYAACRDVGGAEAHCPYHLSAATLLTPEVIVALVALAGLAAIPVVIDTASALRATDAHAPDDPAR